MNEDTVIALVVGVAERSIDASAQEDDDANKGYGNEDSLVNIHAGKKERGDFVRFGVDTHGGLCSPQTTLPVYDSLNRSSSNRMNILFGKYTSVPAAIPSSASFERGP